MLHSLPKGYDTFRADALTDSARQYWKRIGTTPINRTDAKIIDTDTASASECLRRRLRRCLYRPGAALAPPGGP
jgi:hypothetical protein